MSPSKREFHASGKVVDGEPSREMLLLELEPEDDVEPVARLVCIDADERAANPVDRRWKSSSGTVPSGSGNVSCRRG